jgi:hypothetical protein
MQKLLICLVLPLQILCLVPQNSKTILAQKPQTITKKTRMYYTNYHRTNHNVETCTFKRKENYVL